jgi:O-antigen/teichoic acid export membrane protein
MLKNVAILFSGSFLAQVIPFMLLPVLSRLYLPDDFGLYSSVMAVVSILLVASMGRYEQAIIQMKEKSDIEHMFFYCIIFLLTSSMFVLAFIYLFVKNEIYYFVPFIMFLYGFNILLDKKINSEYLYRLMSSQRFVKSVVESVTAISIGCFFYTQYGLVYALLFGVLFASIFTIYKSKNVFKLLPIKKPLLIKYIAFPKYNLPHATLSSFVSYLPIIVIPYFFDYGILGLYAFGMKLAQTPLTLIGSSIYNVVAPELSSDVHASKSNSQRNIKKIFSIQVFISFGIYLFIQLPFTEKLFTLLFGEQWVVSFEFIEYLLPYILLTFLAAPYACVINIFNKQKQALILESIYTLIKVATVLYCGFNLPVEQLLINYSIVSSACLIINLVWFRMILLNYYKKASSVSNKVWS